ncbi:hypothetical protein GLOIN_2v1844575 [Rhizophagus irregularis DAOM 181602=DAOM 197198]|uniref:Protein kinase domain-containing protein n=1 Tax=Rhizophagus irregularis (strain DAOM 181602 / DAOM 197198 / MUCL 43194) TaxID=747089 RepID=A0A2P4PK28_RHIID|nr:hypothetical protein GLOIN_2v1844575 [Rhizophagus irregularis DAOM 181602=DAOM 197198]POG65749.1 hypothetical protein GLOIN_2v1844575 [Rhizophagus irregularis DAOM 181602=DAOM 197198]|eukprot:XP_025172615.1 hypothetical protein GLOIN_2v1844575 [Rhizophagus irregularis DAOM 181602=DAOM 197198]
MESDNSEVITLHNHDVKKKQGKVEVKRSQSSRARDTSCTATIHIRLERKRLLFTHPLEINLKYTHNHVTASDIYSIAILMWEISSGQPPFINYEHENDIVMNVINDIRPKIVPGTPLEYKNLMKECWDAVPLKRPDVYALEKRMRRINLDYQNMTDELFKSEMDE